MQQPPQVPGYHLTEHIATGSTAVVWAGGRSPGSADLAVKVIPIADRDDLHDLTFELSALAMTWGSGEHLVRVVDVVPVLDPPAVAVVMERLRHGTLADLVRARGHLLPGEVVTLLAPIASTLADLHDAAVLHGDLSPANVGLAGDGRPVLLDLGVSAVIGTPCEEVYGTPGFVAPEVVAGGAPTSSADVYALGALGWFALTGEPPPIPADRPRLADLDPTVPAALGEALAQALHPDPELRPRPRELSTVLSGSTHALPVRPGAQGDPATMLTQRVRELARAAAREDAALAASTRADRRAVLRRRSRAAHLRVAAALVAMVLLGGVGVAVASAQRGTAVPTAPGPGGTPSAVSVTAADDEPVDPADRFAAMLEPLVRARADAWNGADPDLLTACFAPASVALEQDRELLAGALAEGHRYEGVSFAARAVEAVSESEDRVTLEATLTTDPYAVRISGGRDTRPGTTTRVRLELVRVDTSADGVVDPPGSEAATTGWRIADIEAVDA
ncbi:serine/threonine-protein kinase [Nostocoides sp. F2B08]|uniref:serine/threonine-protein kinase n=1 Tax=Nostocoides sp. F2B08 TaxID=2653936 RepID=UPI00186AD694|nr:serine/threonine-protein kinase [Tetrasphaera sp. F2B08]